MKPAMTIIASVRAIGALIVTGLNSSNAATTDINAASREKTRQNNRV
jgi:hypothetical protein